MFIKHDNKVNRLDNEAEIFNKISFVKWRTLQAIIDIDRKGAHFILY